MDFVGKRKIWYVLSGILILLGIIGILGRGLNYGIDFAGGTLLEYKFDHLVTLEEFRRILEDLDMETGVALQPSEEEGIFGVLMRSPSLTPAESERLYKEVRTHLPTATQIRAETVWPTIGQELKWQAVLAIIVASIALILYISFRFELRYALAAIIALLHDMLIVVGFFALFYQELNTPFVAALLTIAGYSINDSIVIFDRIRENIRMKRYKTFAQVVNASIVETLPRSIYTSLTTLICVTAILIFGGATLKTFMLALLVGFLSGTYSSIFIASPALLNLQRFSKIKIA